MELPQILDGRLLAKKMQEQLKRRAAALVSQTGFTPVLATILVGGDPASVTYVRMKGNACARVGIGSRKIELPESSRTADVIGVIEALNRDDAVSGILLQHPMPAGVDEQACFEAISTAKDVDGVNSASFGAMSMGLPAFYGATPAGIMELLRHYAIPVAGREVAVIGRSPILGKPAAMMFLNADATVTMCHSQTRNLPEVVRRADIVVAAVGKSKFVQADWIRPGAVIVDAGYHPDLTGDVDLGKAIAKSSAYTPVPGGVGPMTIIELIEQTIAAAEFRLGINANI